MTSNEEIVILSRRIIVDYSASTTLYTLASFPIARLITSSLKIAEKQFRKPTTTDNIIGLTKYGAILTPEGCN